jgi:hypothetical protein
MATVSLGICQFIDYRETDRRRADRRVRTELLSSARRTSRPPLNTFSPVSFTVQDTKSGLRANEEIPFIRFMAFRCLGRSTIPKTPAGRTESANREEALMPERIHSLGGTFTGAVPWPRTTGITKGIPTPQPISGRVDASPSYRQYRVHPQHQLLSRYLGTFSRASCWTKRTARNHVSSPTMRI